MSTSPGLLDRERCPACHSSPGPVLVSLPYDSDPLQGYLREFYGGRLDATPLQGERFEVVECPSCGLLFQRRVPNDAFLDHLYGTAARAEAEEVSRRRGLDQRLAYAHDVERIVRHLGGSPEQLEVLDFGSGTGLWLQIAAALGVRTTGSELHPEVLARLAAAGHQVFTLDELPEARFHFVNTEQVVEHLVDPLVVVRQLARTLRPGGVLRLSVPNGSGVRALLRDPDWTAPKGSPGSLNAIAPLEHLNCFDPTSLRRLGIAAGLEPFRYPLRTEIHPLARLRFAAGALRSRVARSPGTLQLFRKP